MNNCLIDYRVNKEKVKKEAVMNYWVSLFPERKNTLEVEEIIKRISDKGLDKYWARYDDEDKVIEEILKLFASLEEEETKRKVDILCEKIMDQDRWVYFYAPIFYSTIPELYKVLSNSEIIEDVESLVEYIVRGIDGKLYGETYRVLVGEIKIAGQENRLVGETAKERGEEFSKNLLKNIEYLQELYLSYPELYVIMNRTVKSTVKYIAEVVKNTEQEYEQLCRTLSKNNTLGNIEKIQLGTGDSHNHGKTVARLTFSNGESLMYKPRNFQMEESYCKFIDWLNDTIPGISKMSYCKFHAIEDAGWVEYVENEPCENESEIGEFYKKMGELLCILYTLNGKDFHCENIIARGQYPIAIDLETLVHLNVFEKEQEITAVEEKIYHSISHGVHTTALLPAVLQNYKTNETMEVGGIVSGRKRVSPFKVQALKASDSGDISIEYIQKEILPDKNMPIYDGKQVGGNEYFTQVKDSFIHMYQWILANQKQYILKIQELFRHIECRIIYKTTNNYTQLLNTSYHPDLLHNAVDREIYFHRIGLLFNKTQEKEEVLYRDEIKAMMEGDVPVYYIQSDNTVVYNGDKEELYQYCAKSPLEKIEEKISQMSELDLKRQISFIYFSYIGCKMRTDKKDGTSVAYTEKVEALPQEHFIKESEKIAEKIKERAVTEHIHGKNHISWIGFQGMGEETYGITPIGWDMYKGNCGIALYFLYLADVTKKVEYLSYAKDILNSVEQSFELLTTADYQLVGSGAFTGSAGYLYVCSKMMEKGLCSEAEKNYKYKLIEKMLSYIDATVDQEEKIDVLGGLAGTLGVLTTLYSNCEDQLAQKIEHLIRKIADRLIKKAIELEEGKVTWLTNGDIGYVHGNAGIMAQLARANNLLKDQRISHNIEMALRYEREDAYNTETGRWKLREHTHYFSWCNGIGGMILGKMMLRKAGVNDAKLDIEIKQMVEQLKEEGFGYDTSLCHGDMGSLCILKEASRYLKDESLWKGCYATSTLFIKQELKDEYLYILEDWGLMTGVSSIGIGLLEQVSESNYLSSIMCLN